MIEPTELDRACAVLHASLNQWHEQADSEEAATIDSRLDDGYDLAENASSLLTLLGWEPPK